MIVSEMNCLQILCTGAVDRGMHCIYKHDLPRTNQEIKPFLSVHKTATRLNDRSCDVIRMAINQHTLALLGTNSSFSWREFSLVGLVS